MSVSNEGTLNFLFRNCLIENNNALFEIEFQTNFQIFFLCFKTVFAKFEKKNKIALKSFYTKQALIFSLRK